MCQVLFYCTFAYIVGDGQGFNCCVVYNNFFYAVLLAVGKLVVVQADWGGIFFVVGVAKEKVYTADCCKGKKGNSKIFKKASDPIRDNQGKLYCFQSKVYSKSESGSQSILQQKKNK